MNSFSCCVTGHRNIPPEQLTSVEQALQEEIEAAIADGYRHFISGFAMGTDMIFARLVLKAKERFPDVTLEAALPYPGWLDNRCPGDRALLAQCERIQAHSERYSSRCFSTRNRYMVHTCPRVIVVYDGRETGGTANTLRYATYLERDIRLVEFEGLAAPICPEPAAPAGTRLPGR